MHFPINIKIKDIRNYSAIRMLFFCNKNVKIRLFYEIKSVLLQCSNASLLYASS